jgi:hypothetical protein
MKKLLATVLAGSLMMSFIGCTGFSLGPKQAGAPSLPSETTMSIPSLGSSSQGLAKHSATADTSSSFIIAYLAVSYWTLTVQAALFEPVALFKICHRTQPKALDDNSGWKWVVADNGFSATLVGRVEGDSVRWSMTVSGGVLSNFKWFDGTSTITGYNGYWTFHDTAAGNPGVIRFAYNVAGYQEGNVTVSVINPASADYNSYLSWTSNGLNKSFEAYSSKTGEKYLISWNDLSEAGSIENVVTQQTWCWDSKVNNHRNIACQ